MNPLVHRSVILFTINETVFLGATLAAYFSGFPLVVSLGLRHLGGGSKLAAHRGYFLQPDITPHQGVAFTRSFP